MSLHINGKMTKEYLKFIKETRKTKKKINKKKNKLAQNGMLTEAYLKKQGSIDEYFKKMSEAYKKVSSHNFRKVQFYSFNSGYSSHIANRDMVFLRLTTIMDLIDEYTSDGRYMDQELSSTGFELSKAEFNAAEVKVRDELIQKHYDTVSARIMARVLVYYDSELDFWKECLKQLEKLDNIREFE